MSLATVLKQQSLSNRDPLTVLGGDEVVPLGSLLLALLKVMLGIGLDLDWRSRTHMYSFSMELRFPQEMVVRVWGP